MAYYLRIPQVNIGETEMFMDKFDTRNDKLFVMAINHDLLIQSPWSSDVQRQSLLQDLLQKIEQVFLNPSEDDIKKELQVMNGFFLYQPFVEYPYHYKVSGTDEVFENWSQNRPHQKKFKLLQTNGVFVTTTPTEYDQWISQKHSVPFNNAFSFDLIDPETYIRHTATASRMLRYYLEQKWNTLSSKKQIDMMNAFTKTFPQGNWKQTFSMPERLFQYLIETFTRVVPSQYNTKTIGMQQTLFGSWGPSSFVTKRTARLLVMWLFVRLQNNQKAVLPMDSSSSFQLQELQTALHLICLTERIRESVLHYCPNGENGNEKCIKTQKEIATAFRTADKHDLFFATVCRDFLHEKTENDDHFVAVQTLRWFYYFFSKWNDLFHESTSFEMLQQKLLETSERFVTSYRAFIDPWLIFTMAFNTVDDFVGEITLMQYQPLPQKGTLAISDEHSKNVTVLYPLAKPSFQMIVELKKALYHPKTSQRKLAEDLYNVFVVSKNGDANNVFHKLIQKTLPNRLEVPLEKWAGWQKQWHVLLQETFKDEIQVPFYTLEEFLDL